MSWSSGESLAAEVIEAAWPGVSKLKPKGRQKFLLTVIDKFQDQDADFCWADWEDDKWWPDLKQALVSAGKIELCLPSPCNGQPGYDDCQTCYGTGYY